MSTKSWSSRRNPLIALVIAAALAAVTTLTGAAAASADSTGTISGTVLGQGSPDVPLSDIEVSLDLPGGSYVQNTQTAADGTYSFTGLPAAGYIIQFSDYPVAYSSEFWGDTPDQSAASVLNLADGASATANITLPFVDTSGSISGTVVDSGGNPVSGAQVAFQDSFAFDGPAGSTTDSAGHYTVAGLAAGAYTGSVTAPSGVNLVTLDLPGSITLASGQALAGIDATLQAGATIAGTISAEDRPGVGLGNGYVNLIATTGYTVGSSPVGVDGTYSIVGVAAGSFTLQFQPPFGSAYAPQYWHGESALASAEYFPVASGAELTGMDAALLPGASISGSVVAAGTDPGPLPNTVVGATSTTDPSVGSYGFVADDGTYTIVGLAPGSYTVDFQPQQGRVEQWWNDASSAAASTPVVVSAGQAVTGIDAALAPSATISGTVTGLSSSGALFPAQNAVITVDLPDGTFVPLGGTTDPSGNYSVTGLPAGSYKLYFTPQGDTTDFVPQWYRNKSSLSTATTVTVRAGQDKTGIDVTFASATLAGATPRVGGTAEVGSTLTAKPGRWKPGTVSFAYQWLRGGVAISGATGSSYVPVEADAGSPLSVTVTGSEAGYTTTSLTSAQTKPVRGGTLTTSVPTITGAATDGQLLTAVPGAWGPGAVTLTYQWFRGSSRITGATEPGYTPAAADIGKKLTVKVTGTEPGFTSATVASAPTAIVR